VPVQAYCTLGNGGLATPAAESGGVSVRDSQADSDLKHLECHTRELPYGARKKAGTTLGPWRIRPSGGFPELCCCQARKT
jgi:hypothetical protein